MIGTIIPAGLLIVLGVIYISTGGHNHMDMSQGFFPDLSKFNNLVWRAVSSCSTRVWR